MQSRPLVCICFLFFCFFLFYDIYASSVVFSIQGLLQEFLQEDFPLQEKCIIRGTVPVVCLFKKSYTSFHLLVTGRRRTICFVARKLSFLFLMRGMVGAESDLSNDNAYWQELTRLIIDHRWLHLATQ